MKVVQRQPSRQDGLEGRTDPYMVRYSSAVRAALWLPLRTALAAKGFDPGSAEGIFGDGTEAELKAFL